MRRAIFFAAWLISGFYSSISFGATYGGGSGTAADPYQIATKADLLALGAATADYNKCFILTGNINLTGTTYTKAIIAPPTNSTDPLYQGTAFTGKFNGNNHSISNLKINTTTGWFIGLFGCVGSGGQVSNLSLTNVDLTGYNYVGGLCGYNDKGDISGCSAAGKVTGVGSCIGGLLGKINYGVISRCYAASTVTGNTTCGGLVGENDYGFLIQCYATGTVTASSHSIGGLVGKNMYGTVSQCYAAGAVTGSLNYVGGLCGSNLYGTLSQCYAAGTVTGNNAASGGLCGDNCGTISECYAKGAVTGPVSYTGGLCGRQGYSAAVMQNSFWDVESSGLTVGYNLDLSEPGKIINVVGKTTSQMQTASTFTDAGWDLSNTDGDAADWILSGVAYPHLIYEITGAVPGVIAMTWQNAAAVLVAANFQVENMYVVSDSIPAGQVISQSPAAGNVIPCGSMISLMVSAGSKYSGSGTEEDPYLITGLYEFLLFTMTPADYGSHFLLTADIDMAGFTFKTAVIAPDTNIYSEGFQGTKFTGHFDGRGHHISNLYISATRGYYIGLFGYISSPGQINNLGLTDVNITGYSKVGGLCGYNDAGLISQCYMTGTVTGAYYYTGGLCACNYRGKITQCHAAAVVNGNIYAGGLCGYNSEGTISQCYASVTITGGSTTGGLCGSNSSGTISQCYATGTVSVSGNGVGGLCGYNSISTVSQCYSSCVVTGSAGSIGGLIGANSSSSVTNSFWDIAVSGQATSAGGTGKTTAEMQTISTFTDAGWDLSNTDGDASDWFMSGVEYPHLISETSIVMPDYVGMTKEDAYAALLEANFQIVIVYSSNETIPINHIAGQSLKAGVETACGSIMTLIISRGNRYGGSGTAVDPYRIGTPYELMILAETPADYDSYIVMTADIDLAGWTFNAAVISPDTVVDGNFNGTVFTGHFDGRGHSISNLNINTTTGYYIGLFGRLGGEVTGLGLENINITGAYYVGGLCGYNGAGTIGRCYSTGVVTGIYDYVGGLCGNNYAGTVSQCYSAASVTGRHRVGGLFGYNDSGIIRCCYGMGSVTGTGDYVGGFCGQNVSGAINQCYSTGAVSGTSSYVGGLSGGNSSGIIGDCFWNMETSQRTTSAGGTGKTTAQMETISTFTNAGWDFSNTDGDPADWFMSGIEYPHLISETNIVMPDFVGMTKADVRAALLAANFYIEYLYMISDTVPAGHVISQSLAAGVDTQCGSTMTLMISWGSRYSGGGTAENPYVISTKDHLMILRTTPADYGSYFVQTADIDLTGETFTTAVIAPDTAVGSSFDGTKFTGVFNGNGHIISNMKVNTGTDYFIGLFGSIGTGGQVNNLGLVNVNVTGYYYVGSLCGYNYGSVSRCFATGTVKSSSSYLGGLCGRNSGAFSQCYSTCEVNGKNYVGGLCSSNNPTGTFSQCYSTGAVNGNSYLGGLCGSNSGTFTNCFWDKQTSTRSTSAGGTGKTTAEMKMLLTYTSAAWDFATIWDICEGTNYPRLRWQIPSGDFDCPDGVGVEDVDALSACWMETVEAKSDIDADGLVNLNDYIKLAQQWMVTGCGTCGGADITGDGNVDQADLDLLAGQWLLEENTACKMADLDNNGKVDLADFAVFALHWLQL